jgi:ABC-type sugar transport system substrate-binding protein
MVTLANNAHIPIMSSDNGFAGSNGKSVPFVGINAQQFGTSTGSLLMSNFAQLQWPAASTDMLLVTNPALPTCNDRTNAEEAKVIAAGFPKSQILNVPTTDNTTEQAFTNTGPVKTANPTVQYWLVAGCNDDVAFGAAKALVSAGVSPSNVDAVGLGGDLACQIWAAGEPNVGFRATNYINASGIGSDAVHEMYENVAKGVAFPPSTAVTPISMTQANYQSIDKC